MKILVRLLVLSLMLAGGITTASFADGGAPPPTCSPGHCTQVPTGPLTQ